jgi:hypothetical protein
MAMRKVWTLFLVIMCVTCSFDPLTGTTDETNSRIAVKVVFDNDRPAADASLKLFRDSALVPLAQSTARSDGTWLFDSLTPGTYSLWAENADSLEACAVIVVPHKQTVSCNLTLVRGSSLTANVRMQGGENPNSVLVQILGSDKSARADTAGRLTIRMMAKGAHTLRFSTSVQGYTAQYRQIAIESGVADTLKDTVIFTMRNPFPTNSRLNAVAYGEGRFVAVGNNGTIITSTDGEGWSLVASGQNTLRSISWGNDRFVVVGENFGTMTSTDGIHWSTYTLLPSIDSNSTTEYLSVTYCKNQFVVSGLRTVYTSSDGLIWKEQSIDQNLAVRAMAYGNSAFVGVGGACALVSTDGTTWSSFVVEPDATPDTSIVSLYGIIWGGNQFVAYGKSGVYTSMNGRQWTKQDIGLTVSWFAGYRVKGAVWYGGYISLVCCKACALKPDSVKIVTSTDGITWLTSLAWTTMFWNEVLAVCHGGNSYVAVGNNGLITSSADGKMWHNRSSFTTETLNDVCSHSGALVAVGRNGTIISSSDGAGWKERSSGTTKDLSSIVWGEGFFVSVGAEGTICTSSDGSVWSLSPSPTQNDISSIAWGKGLFVATGANNIIIASENGKPWHIVSPALDTCFWVAGGVVTFGNNGFVIVNALGQIYFSSDGLTWSLKEDKPASGIYGVLAWGAEKYVAIGIVYSALRCFFTTSTDGTKWADPQPIPQSPNMAPKSLKWGANQFVLLDGNGLYSADGVTWLQINNSTAFQVFNSCVWDGTQYIFVGDFGAIATCPAFSEF